jgi:hypothetical protein
MQIYSILFIYHLARAGLHKSVHGTMYHIRKRVPTKGTLNQPIKTY